VSNEKNYIKWEHYVQLHQEDLKQMSKRVCPKITNRHLVLDSFSKMNVKLAAQVFININVGIQLLTTFIEKKL